MPTVREFKEFTMPISHLTNSGSSIESAVNAYLHNFEPPTFEWEIVTVTKLDDEQLLIGIYVTYDNTPKP